MEYKDLKLQEVIPPTTKVRGFPDDIYHETIMTLFPYDHEKLKQLIKILS